MSIGFQLNFGGTGSLLKPAVSGWEGPFYRLEGCQEMVLQSAQNFKSPFMNSPEPAACWLVTLQGHGYYKKDQHRHLLHPGRVLVVKKPDQGSILADAKGLPWNFLVLNITGDPGLRIIDFVIHKFGSFQTLSLQGLAIQKAIALVQHVKQNQTKSAHEWSAEIFQWLNDWWSEVERDTPPLTSSLDLPKEGESSSSVYGPGSIKNLAQQIGYSRAYLTRRLKQQWGETPGKVLRKTRLEEAARLLRTSNQKISEIALRVGFSCSTSFIRSFNQMYGVSPLTYRHTNRT